MSEQPTSLFTRLEEIDIDFIVFWIATCSCETSRKLPCSRTRLLMTCSRTREEDRESPSSTSSPKRSTTKNAFSPCSEKSRKMIKYMGYVELFELRETIPKVQCKEFLLYWSQGIENQADAEVSPMDIGSSLNPERCHQEGATSWPSLWED